MKKDLTRLIKKADESNKLRKFSEAGRQYEEAANISTELLEKLELLKKAREAFHESGMTEEEIRCYLTISEFLIKIDKADCLYSCWLLYLRQIVAYEYDCSFEWRGEISGTHDSYQENLNNIQSKALKVLIDALTVKEIDQKKLLEQAIMECSRMEREGGWGAARCWKIIEDAIRTVDIIK